MRWTGLNAEVLLSLALVMLAANVVLAVVLLDHGEDRLRGLLGRGLLAETRGVRSADAPVIARTSELFSLSEDHSWPMTWVSNDQPSGNIGRSGRSIIREVSTSFSLGRPSRRKNPPGILPPAKVFSR